MSGRTRQFVGTILTVAGSVIPGLNFFVAAALIGGGMALSMSGARSEARAAQRRARAAQNSLALRGNVRGTHEHHLLVFGKARVGGIIVAEATLNGPDMPAQYFYLGVAHSICHEGGCEGFEAVWIDDTRIPAADINPVTGEVTAGPYAGLLKLTHYRGTGTQGADPDLTVNNLDYSTAYRRGIQWTLARFTRPIDSESFVNAFKGRFPILTVESKGIRCYDPRKDSTNGGAGAHRYSDVLTWEWTDNFILQAATYSIMKKLHGGEGIPPESIVWATVAAAANVADEMITTPAGQQKRFRGNGVLVSHDKNSVNLQKLLDAGLGKRVEVGGMFEFHCGWRAPTFTIDHTWIAGPVEILPRGRLEGNYNFVRVNYNDAAQDYKTIEAPPYINAAYEADDGGERVPRDLTLPMVSDKYQAQYCSQILGKKSRDKTIIEFGALNLKALDVKPWETGQVSLPGFPELAGKYFRIEQWTTGANGVSAVLEEDKASNYDVETFQTPASGDAPVISIEGTMPPTNVTAVGVADGIRISWTPPPAYTFRFIEIYRSNNPTSGFVYIDETSRGGYYIDNVTDGATWYYKLAARTNFGTYSGFSAVVSATAKQAADGSSQLGSNLNFESGSGGWTADSGRWSVVQENPRAGSWAGKFTSTGAAQTDVFRNSKKFPVGPGDLVVAYGYLLASAGADGTAHWRVSWLDSAGTEIATSAGDVLAPPAVYTRSRVSAAAPAGTAYGRMEVVGTNISTGNWWADDGYLVVTHRNLDEIPDGTVYGRPRQTALTSGEVDLSRSGVINRSADYIAEATTRKWAAESGATVGAVWTTNLQGKPTAEQIYNQLIDSSFWELGSTADQNSPNGLFPNFQRNQSHSNENIIVSGIGPHGKPMLLWDGHSEDGLGNGPDGGWNTTGFSIDPKKTYRFCQAFKFTGALGGTFYHGVGGSTVDDLGQDNVNSNPYFQAVGSGTFTLDRWYLAVGYVHPHTHVGTAHSGAIYDMVTGAAITGGTDYKWVDGSTLSTNQRSYLFYSSNTSAHLQFAPPRVEVVDGNEPSIYALLTDTGIVYNKSVDILADGATYARTKGTALTAGEVNLSLSGVINKSADNISESGSRKWAAESGAQVFTGKSWTGLVDRNLGNIADDATYGRTKLTALTSGEVDLSKSGVLNKSADQISESGSRKWAAESGAQVFAGKSITGLVDRTLANIADTADRYASAQVAGSGDGFQILSNTDFVAGSLSGYTVYDNNGSGQVTLTAVSDNTAPNSSGYRMRVSTTGTGPTPGAGGFYRGIGPDSGAFAVDTYHRGSTIVWRIRAKIPSGKNISWHSNATGNEVGGGWLTSTAGTGDWFDYVFKQIIGKTGTFSSTGFFAIAESGAVDWDVAVCSAVCISFTAGYAITAIDANRLPLTDFASGHANKNVDNVGDGATFGRTKQTALTSGEVDLTKAGVINRSADNIAEAATRKWAAESGAELTTGKDIGILADGATYGRTKLTALTSGEVDLSKSGVLNKSADQISESGSRKWAAESGADVTSGKSVNVLTDVKTVAQFFTFTQTIVATGAGSVSIPVGANSCIIRAWGGGGGGARTSLEGTAIGGGGGGAGCKKTVIIRPSDHGGTISYNVGPGGAGRVATTGNGTAGNATTVTSSGLSFTNLNLSAGGGGAGTTAAGGAGGTASGGDTNVSGNSGVFGVDSIGGSSATVDNIVGTGGDEDSFNPEQPGGGGAGNGAGDGQTGANGMVTFTWAG